MTVVDAVHAATLCPALIGREEPLAVLHELHRMAIGGDRSVALVSGEAGIGKTRLLSDFLNGLAGTAIIKGRAFENDRSLSLAPILDALGVGRTEGPADASDDSSQTSPAGHAAAAAQERRARFVSLADELEQTSFGSHGDVPGILAIEDIHWADETTLDFLLFLLRHRNWPGLLILTFRENEGSVAFPAFLAALHRLRVTTEIQLTRLDPGAVARMVTAIFALPHEPRREFSRALADLTDGNPLFVEETLSALIRTGRVTREGLVRERPWLVGIDIPRSVQLAVALRMPMLSSDARRVVEVAAVAGQRFDFAVLAKCTGIGEAKLLGSILALIEAQFVVEESADVFAFRHALTRQAIYQGLLARERLAIHRTIASLCEDAVAAGEVARTELASLHFHAAEDWEKAAVWGARAGERAEQVNAPEAAVSHFSWAIEAQEHLGRSPDLQILRRRAQALAWLGQFGDARADLVLILDEARRQSDLDGEWWCLVELARLSREDNIAAMDGLLEDALAIARLLGDRGKTAHTLSVKGFDLMMRDRPHEAIRLIEEALQTFTATGDRTGQAIALDHLGWSHYIAADLAGSNRCYRTAVPLFRETGNIEGLANSMAGSATGGADYFQSPSVWPGTRLDDMIAAIEATVTTSRRANWRSGECRALIWGGLSAGIFGEYGRALDWAARGQEIARQDNQLRYAATAEMLFGALSLDMLDPEKALHHLDSAINVGGSIGSSTITTVTAALRGLALGELDGAGEAMAALRQVLDEDQLPHSLGHRMVAAAMAEIAVRANRPEEALALIDRLTVTSPRRQPVDTIPRLVWMRGEALVLTGDLAAGLDDLERAAAFADTNGLRPLSWRAHLSAGRALLGRRQLANARAHFAAAERTMEAIGSTLASEDIRQAFLSRARARLPEDIAWPRAANPFGLTPRELEVALLIGRGLSNRAIAKRLRISERTTEKHVENALSKMMVASRTQIALIVADWPETAGRTEARHRDVEAGPN